MDINDINSHLNLILDEAPVLLWVANAQKEVIYFNNSWLKFTGKTLEEELINGWQHNVHPDDLDKCLEAFHKYVDERRPYEIEYRLKRHDGVYRYILNRGAPIFDSSNNFNGFVGSCTDVHEKHELQNELAENIKQRNEEIRREKLLSEAIFNASIDILLIYDNQLHIKAFNSAAAKNFDLTNEHIDKHLFEVFPNAKNSTFTDSLLDAINGKQVNSHVYQSRHNGMYYEIFFIPMLDSNKETYAVLVVSRDISSRINSEKELKDLNLELTERNRELQSTNDDLSSFNYVASHDLQEPLRKVNMFASRILELDRNNLSPQSFQYFDRINSAIVRMQNLINALLDYSRTETSEVKRTKTNLNTILREVVRNLDDSIKNKNAIINYQELPTLSVIPLQIHQLFVNLISNSLKYAKPNVDPVINITCDLVELPERENQRFWKIVFEDNGIGFDIQYKQKIFELFQRLHGKLEIQGTGIGLAICRKILSNHNGFITAEGKSGEGAAFSIYLPDKNIS